MRGRSWVPVVVVLAVAPGCVYATKFTMPGGRIAFRIHCQSQPQCAEKAAEVCPGDYEVVSSKVTPDGYANNGTGYASSTVELTIACKTDATPTPVARASAPPAAPAASAPPAADPMTTCVVAHASLKETAAFWSQLHPDAKRLDDLPSIRDFDEVCHALPERVQRCLDARYREAHDKPCLSVLKRLDAGEKNRIDSLFLE
jgi:hypothetical protein